MRFNKVLEHITSPLSFGRPGLPVKFDTSLDINQQNFTNGTKVLFNLQKTLSLKI